MTAQLHTSHPQTELTGSERVPPNTREETPPHDQRKRPRVPEDANEYRRLDVPHSDAPRSTQLRRAVCQEPSFLDERLPRIRTTLEFVWQSLHLDDRSIHALRRLRVPMAMQPSVERRSRHLSVTRPISAKQNEVWDVISTPGYLEHSPLLCEQRGCRVARRSIDRPDPIPKRMGIRSAFHIVDRRSGLRPRNWRSQRTDLPSFLEAGTAK